MPDLPPASPDPLSRLGAEALRPEARLLLACVATGRGASDPDALGSLLGKDLDWHWLAEAARLHAVLPLVHRRLLAAGVDRPELRDLATGVSLRNLRLTTELLAIARDFEAQGIRMLAWKGPALAMLAWGDITLRECRDLDLVVFPEEYERAASLLRDRGYHPEVSYSGARARALFRSGCETVFRGPVDCRVELHWRFSAELLETRLPVRDAWASRQAVRLGTGSIMSPGREDLLLSLGEHGAKHAWERVGWIADLSRLGGDPGLDWEGLLGRARTLGSERMLLLGLMLAQRLLGAELPAVVGARCAAHPTLSRLAEWVTERLFAGVPGHIGAAERRAFQLRIRERLSDRARLTAGMLFGIGEGDFAVGPLPEALSPVYYLVRPFRLAWRYGSGFLGALVRR